MAHFEIFCFCQLAAEKEGLSGENWRLPQTRDRKVTIYEMYFFWFIHIREGFYSRSLSHENEKWISVWCDLLVNAPLRFIHSCLNYSSATLPAQAQWRTEICCLNMGPVNFWSPRRKNNFQKVSFSQGRLRGGSTWQGVMRGRRCEKGTIGREGLFQFFGEINRIISSLSCFVNCIWWYGILLK